MERFKERIISAIEQASSLDEFKKWLSSQNDVESMIEERGLVKTYPPLKEIRVVFRKCEEKITKIIDVCVNPNGSIAFAGLHDP